MDKYGAINVKASLKEDEPVNLIETGMEKQGDVCADNVIDNSKTNSPK